MASAGAGTGPRVARPWLRPPRLRAAEPRRGEERHATWFELFFDLVFVVAVAELAQGLAADPSARGFVRFALLFLPVWWIWILYTYYADRFDTDDAIYRLLVMVGMLAIVAIGVNLRRAMVADHPRDAPFALSYLAARAVVVVLYLRAARYLAIGRRLARIRVVTGGAAVLLWLGSLLVPAPIRYALWIVALLIEMATPFVASGTYGALPVTLDHVPERYGLFTLIALGGSVIAVATGLGDVGWGPASTLVAGAAFGLACCAWWLNFDFAGTAALWRAFLIRQVYVYGHFPAVVGLTAAGAGALLAIEHATDDHLSAGARWALCGGLAVYQLAFAGVNLAAKEERRRQLWRFRPTAAVVAVDLALAAFGGRLPPAALVLVLLLALGGMIGQKVAQAAAGPPRAVPRLIRDRRPAAEAMSRRASPPRTNA